MTERTSTDLTAGIMKLLYGAHLVNVDLFPLSYRRVGGASDMPSLLLPFEIKHL